MSNKVYEILTEDEWELVRALVDGIDLELGKSWTADERCKLIKLARKIRKIAREGEGKRGI